MSRRRFNKYPVPIFFGFSGRELSISLMIHQKKPSIWDRNGLLCIGVDAVFFFAFDGNAEAAEEVEIVLGERGATAVG